MPKEKVAIAIDESLLRMVDAKVDARAFPSRSQAIEFLLRSAMQEELLKSAVLLLKGDHQAYSLKKIKGKILLSSQVSFLRTNGIKDIHIVTQKSKLYSGFLDEVDKIMYKNGIHMLVHEQKSSGTANALALVKNYVSGNFIAMSADLHMRLNLMALVKKHLDAGKTATMGLMMRSEPAQFGNAVLDGDLIVDFQEKPKQSESKSYAVNAGIYIFSQGIFDFLRSASSLERDVFPRLAKKGELVGHFTRGEYRHMEE